MVFVFHDYHYKFNFRVICFNKLRSTSIYVNSRLFTSWNCNGQNITYLLKYTQFSIIILQYMAFIHQANVSFVGIVKFISVEKFSWVQYYVMERNVCKIFLLVLLIVKQLYYQCYVYWMFACCCMHP